MTNNRVRVAHWTQDRSSLRQIRDVVFIQEQQVPSALEWDDEDAIATHFLALSPEGVAIGTARLLSNGQIGRMAVLQAYRSSGVGAQLLQLAIHTARQRGDRSVFLHAQSHAINFYQAHGFIAEGHEYLEAGIPHRNMCLTL